MRSTVEGNDPPTKIMVEKIKGYSVQLLLTVRNEIVNVSKVVNRLRKG
jgi:hypothetical protein